MTQMLTSEILKQNIKYNDDIEYVAGDDIYAPTKDVCHSTYSNEEEYIGFIADKFANECPKLLFQEITFQSSNLEYMTSIVQHKNVLFDFLILEDFKNVVITSYDTDISLDELCRDRYDSVNYYAMTDILEIPKKIKHFLDLGYTLPINVAIYNYKYAQVKHSIFNDITPINCTPKIIFKYIPAKGKYSYFEKNSMLKITHSKYATYSCKYQNLENKDFKKIITDCQTLAFDADEQIFYAHSNSNQTKVNVLCQDIAKEGLLKPIQMRLLKNDKMTPFLSNKRFLISCYLNLPKIPICIINKE